MRTESNIRPTDKYLFFVGETRNYLLFIDLDSIEEHTRIDESGETTIYSYDEYKMYVSANEEYVNKHVDELYALAKQSEYNSLAAEIREKRNRLLDESDKECLSDRTPSQEMIEYRQALRDITKQSGFPYDVIWPVKP